MVDDNAAAAAAVDDDDDYDDGDDGDDDDIINKFSNLWAGPTTIVVSNVKAFRLDLVNIYILIQALKKLKPMILINSDRHLPKMKIKTLSHLSIHTIYIICLESYMTVNLY